MGIGVEAVETPGAVTPRTPLPRLPRLAFVFRILMVAAGQEPRQPAGRMAGRWYHNTPRPLLTLALARFRPVSWEAQLLYHQPPPPHDREQLPATPSLS